MIDRDRVLGAWNLDEVPTPAYIIHETLLRDNLATISRVRREAGVEIIVALKANATWPIFGLLAEHSDGATASSLAEARLVEECMGCKAHTYATDTAANRGLTVVVSTERLGVGEHGFEELNAVGIKLRDALLAAEVMYLDDEEKKTP